VLANSKPIKREATCEAGIWYLCGISPYRAQDNRIEGVVINLADVSNLKMSEEHLRLAHAYDESIINTIHEPLVVLDEELRVVSASQSFYRFFDAKPENTLRRPLADTDAHHLDSSVLRAFLERIESGNYDAENYEITVDLPSLGQRSLVVTADKIRGAGPIEKNILLTFSDVTDFKHAALQLAEAKRAAEQASLAKSHFLAAASHDLRQPLQTLSLLCGTMRLKTKDTETLTLLARAERTLADMSGMLAALLDIDQLETGAIQPKLIDYPINRLFDMFKAAFADDAARKGLGWRVVRCSLTVRTDQRLLAEMVRNLLSNAFRYTDKGKILLGCRRHGDRLSIEVWDSGRGIAESEIPRIFEEYHQATDRPQRGGLGLGLAIVQRLGELLGHAVHVRSQVGRGSKFPLLPQRRAEHPSRTSHRAKVARVAGGPFSLLRTIRLCENRWH
jgi:two-component system CheB/CheR fusion protein